ncbi:MAG TPA: MAPEG family protein [Polyangia bacterium]|nr:MAPEG family protein [Polyangia bacterium]
MLLTAANPTFIYYVITVLALSALLIFLWAYSGTVRGKTKTTMNPEDGRAYNAPVVERDPPEVARVLRAHANAQANIIPFLLIGLVFVAMGGGPTMGAALFGAFVFFRVAHAIAYLVGKQPWRTISFVLGGVVTLFMMVNVIRLLIRS